VELPSNVYEVLVVVGIVSLIVGILGAATSVALRLWRARGQERQQLKWLVYATSVVVIGALGAVLLPPPLGDVFYGVMIYGFAGMRVAMGVAILRYRLYDIDLVINRTMVYGSLSVLLAERPTMAAWRCFRECSVPSPEDRAPSRSWPRPWP
jgi:hypothetical protein